MTRPGIFSIFTKDAYKNGIFSWGVQISPEGINHGFEECYMERWPNRYQQYGSITIVINLSQSKGNEGGQSSFIPVWNKWQLPTPNSPWRQ